MLQHLDLSLGDGFSRKVVMFLIPGNVQAEAGWPFAKECSRENSSFEWEFGLMTSTVASNSKTWISSIVSYIQILMPSEICSKSQESGSLNISEDVHNCLCMIHTSLVQKRLVNNEPRWYTFGFFHKWDILWDLPLTVPDSWKLSKQHFFVFVF